MWQTKVFKTREAMQKFIAKHEIQWQEVFINHKVKTDARCAIEYRPIRWVY